VVKIIRKNEVTTAGFMLLATETAILRELEHPNVVTVISHEENLLNICQVFELTAVSL